MKPKKILIVDDDESIVIALENMLQTKGYITEKAYNGREGIKVTKKFRPDLILLDIMMPFVNGFEFSSMIRKNEDLNKTKIILITAKGEMNDKKNGYAKGCDDYIIKPFSMEQLLTRIEFLINGNNN